ncbi:hypothetical protein ABNC90_08385 [Paenibacillus larvae]|uniref:Uncharacterized protein n=7 Tax=Caudoviricetes TaxID=2731619 RepID=A0A345KQI5_9CAUD|nr:hypothetical protein [Paenibacillus larvae]YP_009202239.1 hypothetical protein AVV24_gp33 [Bacteriophage Lily]YP_009838928.1 hypothetical protein HWB74_gp25 [Paenibacillus phage Jacopo]AXF40040.1 hypothetical protein BLOOM_25 [Paenibacillus phage Bloom]AXF40399.1 hypothetical protein LYCANUS1_25 [Paenibacillus phage Genki]AXF42267.1 hypothetical protein LYCANUS2_25 [Paenibacillus phage Gryphonian]AXH45287.1 hypothetical protein ARCTICFREEZE_25 [Paenibacillus phage Arcticfreeze]AXH45353.1 
MYLVRWGKTKSIILSMVFLMALTSFMNIGINPVVAAEKSDSKTELVAMVVKDNLERIGDLLKIKDKQKLKQALEANNNLELSVQDIQSQVDNFNTMLLGLQGQDKKEQLLKALQEVENEIVKAERASGVRTFGCSDVLGGIGLSHSFLYGRLALALGVSGPLGLGIATGAGALYYLGSLACPK